MTVYLAIERRRLLARQRNMSGVMLGVSLGGIVWADVAVFSLVVMALLWVFLLIDTTARIRQMDLVVDDSLLEPDKEVSMKR